MALVTLSLSDETYQKYIKHNPQNPQKAMKEQLERYEDSSPKDRVLVFNQEQRTRVEKIFRMPIEDMDKLVAWIEKLVSVDVGGISIPLTEGQRKRLESEARFFNNQDFATYTSNKIKKFFFQTFGG